MIECLQTGELAEADFDQRADREAALADAAMHVRSTINHLQVRLDDDDPILVAHRRLFEVLEELDAAANATPQKPYEPDPEALASAYRAFVEAAKPRTASITADWPRTPALE